MDAEINTTTIIHIWLTPDEARWLRTLVQNPLCAPNEEPTIDQRNRKVFFDVLTQTLGY